jgi:hypothetical protein
MWFIKIFIQIFYKSLFSIHAQTCYNRNTIQNVDAAKPVQVKSFRILRCSRLGGMVGEFQLTECVEHNKVVLGSFVLLPCQYRPHHREKGFGSSSGLSQILWVACRPHRSDFLNC